MTRHAEVASSAAVKKAIPALASLAAGIGDETRMVRNMGTTAARSPKRSRGGLSGRGAGLSATVVTKQAQIAASIPRAVPYPVIRCDPR